MKSNSLNLVALAAIAAGVQPLAPLAARADAAAAAAADVDLRVAYVEATGSQYIDTGVLGNPNVKAEATFSYTVGISSTDRDRAILGAFKSGTERCQMIAKDRNYLTCGVNQFWACSAIDPTAKASSASDAVTLVLNTAYTVTADFRSSSQTIVIDGGAYSGKAAFQGSVAMADTGFNLYAFARNNAGTADCLSSARLYSLKIWKNGALVRDFAPACSNGVYGLWDHQNDRFYASASSTPLSGTPLDLKVPYIESNGGQYIDTGVLGNPGVKAEATFAYAAGISSTDRDRAILGAFKSGTERCQMIAKDRNYLTCGVDKFWRCNANNPTVESDVQSADSVTLALDTTYTVTADFQANSQTVVIDGGEYSRRTVFQRSVARADTGFNLYAFARNNAGTADCLSTARIYSLKIWKNGTLVRDFVPARRESEVGLWDNVSQSFFTSAGAPFVASAAPRAVSGEPDYYAEWIESNGTSSFINTGAAGRPGTRIETEFAWKAFKDCRLIADDEKYAIFAPVAQTYRFVAGGNWVTMAGGTYELDKAYSAVLDVQSDHLSLSVTDMAAGTTCASNRAATVTATSSRPLLVFARHGYSASATAPDLFAKARIHALKVWKDGVLVRDFVPGIRDGEGCLYDKVTDACYLSADASITSAAGLVGPPAGTPMRPKWELSYLGSEGNSYIDTGVVSGPGVKAEAVAAWMDPSIDSALLGARNGSGNRFFMIWTYANHPVWGPQSGYNGNNDTAMASVTYVAGRQYTIVSDFGASSQSLVIDGTTVKTVSNSLSAGQNLYMFAGNWDDGTAKNHAKARIHALKIWKDGELVRHYVPVIADNGGPYLYDKRSQTFLQGTTSGLWDVGEKGERYSLGTSIIVR